MALKGTTAQERAWNFFCDKGLSHYAVSGVMASIRAESGFNPRNLQNSCEKKSGYTDETYTAAVDNGIYGNFVRDPTDMGTHSGPIGAENRIFSILPRRKRSPSEMKRCSWNSVGGIDRIVQRGSFKAQIRKIRTGSIRYYPDRI